MSQNYPFSYIRILGILVILLLSLITVSRLLDGYSSLLDLQEVGKKSAVDLKQRHKEVTTWFKGEIVYKKLKNTVYPPASMVALYPITGWLSLANTRILWAFLMTVGIGWLIYFLLKINPKNAALEKVAIIILVAGCPSTFITILHGQLILFVLPLVLLSLLLFYQYPVSWKRDLLICFLFTLSLVKPTISAPFFLLLLFGKNGFRVAVSIVILYLFFTLFALSFQAANPLELLSAWFHKAAHTYDDGDANLQQVTRKVTNFNKGNFIFSIIFLGIYAIWLYFNRHKNYWLIIGTTAIFARLWIYHRMYDNLLIVIGMAALYAIWQAKKDTKWINHFAATLLSLNYLLMFIPGPLKDLLLSDKGTIAEIQSILWTISFLFLGVYIQLFDKTNSRIKLSKMSFN